MNEKLIKAYKETLRKDHNWREEDINACITWTSMLLTLLIKYEFPTGHPKFPELLRGLANLFEISHGEENGKN